MSEMINIPGRLHAADSEGIVTGTNEVFDDNLGVTQEDLNASTLTNLENLQEGLDRKQNILTPGTGITISQDGTISTIIDGSIGKIVTDHTAITTPVEGLLYLEQTSTQGTYAQYIYEDEEWSSLGNITLSFGLDDVPTAGSNNVAKSGGTKQYVDSLNYKLEAISFTTADNAIINAETGVVAGLTGAQRSDFIKVTSGSIYIVNAKFIGSNGIAGYSSNTSDSYNANIASQNSSGSTYKTEVANNLEITIPAGVNYIRISTSDKTNNPLSLTAKKSVFVVLDEFEHNIEELENEVDDTNTALTNTTVYQEEVIELFSREGYWTYNLSFAQAVGWHCTAPIPCNVGDVFTITSSIVVGTSAHITFDAYGQILGLLQTETGATRTQFTITQEQYDAGVRFVGFSFKPVDTPSVLKTHIFTSTTLNNRFKDTENKLTYNKDVLDLYPREGYWRYDSDTDSVSFAAVAKWHCTNLIPCEANDEFIISSTILIGASVHAMYDANKEFVGLLQTILTTSMTRFIITQEQYDSGVRYVTFSFKPADTPSVYKIKHFSSQETENRLVNIEKVVSDDICIFDNIKPNYAFAHAAPLVFRNKLNAIDHDMQVLLFGDSITAYTQVVSVDEEPDAPNRPCGMQRNSLTWMIWNSLCNNKPQCDRFDSEVNIITESGTFALSDYRKFNNAVNGEIHYNPISSDGYRGEFNVDGSVYRETTTTDDAVSFNWNLEDYEKLAFIHRLGCDGTTEVTLTCTSGKVQVYDEGTSTWVEANGYTFSQFLQNTARSAGGSSLWVRQMILNLRKVQNAEGTITLTFTNTGTGTMYYWGTERWNGNTLRVINLGKAGRPSSDQLFTIHDEIYYRHPDLIIYQLPVWNELKAGGSYTTNWNQAHRDVIDLIKAQSDNWNNYQMMIYIPHTQVADWDKDRNKRFQKKPTPAEPTPPITNEVSMTELTREELLLSGYDLNVPILNLNSLIIDFAHSLGIDMQTFLGSMSDDITDGTTAEVNVTDKYTADGVHMSKTGAKFTANCLLPMLK